MAPVKDPYEVLLHPHVTEKTMNLMDRENKLEFIVRRESSKTEVKRAVERLFNVKIVAVNTFTDRSGKHAIVKFAKGYKAEDVGMRIGVF